MFLSELLMRGPVLPVLDFFVENDVVFVAARNGVCFRFFRLLYCFLMFGFICRVKFVQICLWGGGLGDGATSHLPKIESRHLHLVSPR